MIKLGEEKRLIKSKIQAGFNNFGAKMQKICKKFALIYILGSCLYFTDV